MGDSLVIVALPADQDPVNKYSSEDAAHLTILYLGEQTDTPAVAQIIEFVEHAASLLSPFGLSVDYRGELGDDKADVLFFEKDFADRIVQFRDHLLANNAIKAAFHSVEQYPEWTPHLTMGYPEKPALEDDRDYPGFSWVNFDRIAVWTGDSEGPTFRLNDEGRSLSMSDTITVGQKAVEDLFHYGTKGMKWGVRKDKGHEGEKVKTKKLDKLDKQWEQDAGWKAHNAMADRMNKGMIDEFNKDPRWDNPDGTRIDFEDPKNSAKLEEYENEFWKLSDKVYFEELTKLGVNPSGTKKFELQVDDNGDEYVALVDTKVKHAEGDEAPAFKVTRGKDKRITKLTPVVRELKHYGVKGMKWGVRRSPQQLESAREVSIKTKDGGFVKTSGGKKLPPSEDAINAQVNRQKARASTTDSLSNAELRQVVERMNLEQQYNRLAFETDRRSAGRRFVAGLMGKKRYGGEKRRYTDEMEESGERARKMADEVAKLLADRNAS